MFVGIIASNIYDEIDDFVFDIVNCPFLDCDFFTTMPHGCHILAYSFYLDI